MADNEALYPPVFSQTDLSLIQEEAIEEIRPKEAQRGFFSNIFVAPKKDGKMRHLRALNQFVVTHHFGISHPMRSSSPERLADKGGLEGRLLCYSHGPMASSFLRFSLQGQHYQFTCLPFGLSSGSWVFVIALLRELGVMMVQYLDDVLIMAASKQTAQDHTTVFFFLLENLGFVIHPKELVTLYLPNNSSFWA